MITFSQNSRMPRFNSGIPLRNPAAKFQRRRLYPWITTKCLPNSLTLTFLVDRQIPNGIKKKTYSKSWLWQTDQDAKEIFGLNGPLRVKQSMVSIPASVSATPILKEFEQKW